ncbi:hypothetical protein GRX01_13505 [Halobaculum sp. WSA2]|uniref:Uncharacterized protein n=1 Tax=Halobaculum saliterrae TaxID=2073113 RepID=A0A6B0T236_9EURY|nr:hypothetical protein [Halobaculum saliterrae]MXR42350.1 hypothetical protein [Halobaculum saliterrae]
MTLKLPPSGENRWRLATHARVIVYETEDGNELLTVYDCGAAQKPPSAQLIGNLVRVNAEHELERGPTGYAVSMRESADLVKQDEHHYVIEAVEE